MGFNTLPSTIGPAECPWLKCNMPNYIPETFPKGKRVYESPGEDESNIFHDLDKGNILMTGNAFKTMSQMKSEDKKQVSRQNQRLQERPKDESWADITSATETSITSSDFCSTHGTDDQNFSDLSSSNFIKLGTSYSASEESTDTDSYESDATHDPFEDSEASDLTDYSGYRENLNQNPTKKVKRSSFFLDKTSFGSLLRDDEDT